MRTDSKGNVKLAPREAQVLRLLCTDAPSNKELAVRMNISEATVRDYIDNMRDGIHVYSRGALLIWGLQHPEAWCCKWCEPTLHPVGCDCGGFLCMLRRVLFAKVA